MKTKSMVAAALTSLCMGIPALSSAQGLVKSEAETRALLMKMDANKDGRITRQEYLAAMGSVFDKHAGAKGYCTPDEAMGVMKSVRDFSFLTDFNP